MARDNGDQAAAQREAAKKHDEKNKKAPSEAGLHVSTKLTDENHVGKIPQEPHKPKELVLASSDIKERTGVDKVTTTPQKTEGKGTTDLVTTSPTTAAAAGHTAEPKSEAQKVAETARGKGANGKTAKRRK